MSPMLLAAGAVAGTLATFTDWLFMGVLYHSHYERHPGTWWASLREKGDSRAIVASSVVGYLPSFAVVLLCAFAHTHGIGAALAVSLFAWLAGPLPLLVINGFWIRIDPHVTFAHALGWLARLALAGLAAGFVLR